MPSKSKAQPKVQTQTPVKGILQTEKTIADGSKAMVTRGQEKKVVIVTKKPALKATKANQKQKQQKAKPKAANKEASAGTLKKKGKYIHDFYNQEELMKEAALTEILNKKSLVRINDVNW